MNTRFVAIPKQLHGNTVQFASVDPDFQLEYEIPPGDDFIDLVRFSQEAGQLIGYPHIFTVRNGRITTLEPA